MHEFGIIEGVMRVVSQSAEQAQAEKVISVKLKVGEMTEVVEESLQFAYGILSEGTLMEGSTLEVEVVSPRSRCLDCACEFDHDRYHLRCPACDSRDTVLLQGRELEIASIEIDVPDEE